MKHYNRKGLNEDGSRNTVSPSPSPSTSKPYFKPASSTDVSMVLTLLFILTALVFLGFFSVFIGRFSGQNSIEASRRRRQQGRASSSTTQGLDTTTVQSLPLVAYDGNTKEPSDCPVCLGEFEEKETIKLIPYCRHVFHPQCIDTWFSCHVSCPMCRTIQLFGLPSEKNECASESPDVVTTVGNGDTLTETER